MQRLLLRLLLAVLFVSPAAAQGDLFSPGNAAPGQSPLALNTPPLPQGFLQPQNLRYALWATHLTGRRLATFRARFPQLADGNFEFAATAAAQLEDALKDAIRKSDAPSLTADHRAAETAAALDNLRDKLAVWETVAGSQQLQTILRQQVPEATQDRTRQSLRQLTRLISHEETGWPNSPIPTPAPAAETPLRSPQQMEQIWAAMPQGLASVARSEYSRAYHEAYYDGLTGIHSRRYLDHHAGEYAQESEHYQLVADVDHFKKVNDEMGGHQIGDATLKAVAQIWGQELAREGGVGVRWGGEEFWGRVPGDEAKALAVATRVNVRVREEVHKQVGLAKPLTISVGVAKYERRGLAEPLAAFHEAFKRADDAVFEAKHRGRNRIVLHRDGGSDVREIKGVTPDRAQWLLTELLRLAGIKTDMEFGVIRSPVPNAAAEPGGRILVTSGLLESSADSEVRAVLAHEIGHLKTVKLWSLRHIVLIPLAAMAAVAGLLSLALPCGAAAGVGGIVAMTAAFGAMLGQGQEYAADAYAARLTGDPESLIRSYERFYGDDRGIRSRIARLRRDFPPKI